MALIPNDELVAKAWLVAALSLPASGKVATTLPDYTSWVDNEFYQIMQVGGAPDVELPINEPVVSINCFAVTPGSTKPPWGHAHQNAMKILNATYNRRPGTSATALAMPSGYGGALLRSVWPVSQPRRIPSDPSQFAVYNLDVQFSWVASSEVFT